MTGSVTTAMVLSTTRRYAEVVTLDGRTRLAKHAIGNMDLVVGDMVSLSEETNEPIITSFERRRNEFKRSFERRTKLLTANLSRLIIVTQPLPLTNLLFIDRALCQAKLEQIPVCLILNKCDLTDRVADTESLLSYYATLDTTVLLTSALTFEGIADLQRLLHKEKEGTGAAIVAITGLSGVGKSSLISVLIPGTKIRTQEVASKGMGKQTTSQPQAYRLTPEANTYLVDLPGIQNFGLSHLSEKQALNGFEDLAELSRLCRFTNCRHQGDPDCAIKEAIDLSRIPASRLESLQNILLEIKTNNPYGSNR